MKIRFTSKEHARDIYNKILESYQVGERITNAVHLDYMEALIRMCKINCIAATDQFYVSDNDNRIDEKVFQIRSRGGTFYSLLYHNIIIDGL